MNLTNPRRDAYFRRSWTAIPLVTAILICLVGFNVSLAGTDTSRAFQRTNSGHSKRVALVIGNKDYPERPLRNTVHDAEDMGQALSRLGFAVTTVTNLNHRSFVEAIEKFSQETKGAEAALFYFSGHGCQVKGENYLMPVGSHFHSEADISFNAVNAGFVLAKMGEAKARVNIVILDACRSNPFSGSRALNRGLAPMEAPRGTFIAYATAPGDTAADAGDRNGVYTKHLLAAMQVKGLPIEETFKRTAKGVTQETRDKQVPWTSSSLVGDFRFDEKDVEVVHTQSPPPPSPVPMVKRDPSKDKLLIESATSGSVQDIDRLLMEGADVNAEDKWERTALHYAAGAGNIPVVHLLLERGADVGVKDDGGETPLGRGHRYAEVVKALLDKGANVNDKNGAFVLICAAEAGNLKIVKLMLTKIKNVDALHDEDDAGGRRMTALAYAAMRGNFRIAQILLESGANPNAKSPIFGSVLSIAEVYGKSTEIANLLRKYGATLY